MQGNSSFINGTDHNRGQWIMAALVVVAVTITAVFTLARADASEGPTHQRVVVVSEAGADQLRGGLALAGFVEFEPVDDTHGAVARVMKINEEPDVVASEINRTLGPVITAWVEDVD
ncbi:MAG: hypothetical protein ACR2QE_02975 [Acidimicrobiales bacterium]